MSTNFDDVIDFNLKFSLPICDSPRELPAELLRDRIKFLLEEVAELAVSGGMRIDVEAADGFTGEPAIHNHRLRVNRFSGGPGGNLANQADALVDLVYVALGTAVMMGLPWQELWSDVHAANLRKVRGRTKRDMPLDLMKPEGWIGPQTASILGHHGWKP